jgi:hypothetical protein
MIEVDVPIIRSLLFLLSSDAGELSKLFAAWKGNQSGEDGQRHNATSKIRSMLGMLVEISCLISINLHQACCRKIDYNSKKYPIELCQVRQFEEYGNYNYCRQPLTSSLTNSHCIEPGECKKVHCIHRSYRNHIKP